MRLAYSLDGLGRHKGEKMKILASLSNRIFNAQISRHENGSLMLYVWIPALRCTNVFILSPKLHFDLVSGRNSECIIIGPFTHAIARLPK